MFLLRAQCAFLGADRLLRVHVYAELEVFELLIIFQTARTGGFHCTRRGLRLNLLYPPVDLQG